jgi:two-component system chemotaxis response regulator CheB
MPRRDIIVIGTSAGGVDALPQIVRDLPPAFPASVFVVCHFPSGGQSILPEILSRAGSLLASHPRDGETFYPGHIYVAPPDQHLLLAPDSAIQLSREARENLHRPAIDPLFRSAARYYGRRVIAVILTGALYDGTAGLLAVRANGGLGIVQDPDDAAVAAMPQNAAQIAGPNHVVPLNGIAPLLVDLVNSKGESEAGDRAVDPIENMPMTVDHDMQDQAQDRRRGAVSVFSCPECGGTLWQVDESMPLRFRCHVGHAYSAELLLAEQSESLEAAMWSAVRIFREKSALSRQLASRERRQGHQTSAERFDEQADQAELYGSVIRGFLVNGSAQPPQPIKPREASGPPSKIGGGDEIAATD